MSAAVSDQLDELRTELQDSIAKLNALIDNRSAWADGIEGCREGVALLGRTQSRLQAITEITQQLESDLTCARAELERWSAMHAELSAVERDLRAEGDRCRAALEEQIARRSHLRVLAEKLVREIASS